MTVAVRVEPAGRAVAWRGARHRADRGVPARIQGPQAGHLDRLAPGTVGLADHEPLLTVAADRVVPAGRAVSRRGARHRADMGVTLVQRRQAGHLDRLAPRAAARTTAGCPHPASAPARARPVHQVTILLMRHAIPGPGPPPSARRRRVLYLFKIDAHAPGWLAHDHRNATIQIAGNPGRPEPARGRGRQSSARGGSAAGAPPPSRSRTGARQGPSRTGRHAPASASEPACAPRCGHDRNRDPRPAAPIRSTS